MKADLSNLRRGLQSNFMRQEKEREALSERLGQVEERLRETREAIHERSDHLASEQLANMAEVRQEFDSIKYGVGTLRTSTTTDMGYVKGDLGSIMEKVEVMSNQSRDEIRNNLEIMKDALWRVCADVTALRYGESTADPPPLRLPERPVFRTSSVTSYQNRPSGWRQEGVGVSKALGSAPPDTADEVIIYDSEDAAATIDITGTPSMPRSSGDTQRPVSVTAKRISIKK